VRQKGFAPIIIFLVVIASVGLGYFFSKNFDILSQLLQSKTPKPTLSPDEKTLQNWSVSVSGNTVTLSDNNSKYSFIIPEGWKTQLKCTGDPNDKCVRLMSPDLVENPMPLVIKGQLIRIAPPGSSSFSATYVEDLEDFCKSDALSKIQSCKFMELNGQKIIKKVYANYSFIDVAVIKDNKINLTVSLEYPAPAGYKDNTFEQFLSSLNFTQ
jgi:hypothetical protein